jgi:glycosyltransferase involved in cell wall biosynthesis
MKKTSRPRLLVVAPGHRGRGGIDSVVRLHEESSLSHEVCWKLLSTYDDASAARKILAALRCYLLAPAALVRTEIVHIHLAGEISLLRKLPVLIMAKALRKHVLVHVHAHSEESLFVKTPRWAWKYSFYAADRVIALSPTWANAIRRHAPHATVVVVPNPVKLFSPTRRRHNDDSPRVLYVGRLEARKGYDTLLTAASLVLKKFPQTEFWFAGHGELESARAQAQALGIDSQVHLLGWITGSALEQIYDDMDVFCLPSHSEGVPMSMLEAMSHALPVICTAVGGVPDIIVDGENGLLVTPGNPEAVAMGILRLLRNPKMAESVGRSGYKTVRERCSLDAVGAQMSAIYKELASPAARARDGAVLAH